MQKSIPIITIDLSLDQFSTVGKSFPAHELPLWVHRWGASNVNVTGRNGETHAIQDIESEVKRMALEHGEHKLQNVFGASYIDGIELAINRVIEKERALDGGENTAKPENGTSAEARI